MELDITVRILRHKDREDGKMKLVVDHTANVQPFPLGISDYQTRLSLLNEINAAIVDKIEEINKRQSGLVD